MKKLITLTISLAVLFGFVVFTPQMATAAPADSIKNGVTAVGGGSEKPTLGDYIKTVVNILLYLLGAIAVVMIVIGGIRYTTSNGDTSAVKAAKDTILYAVIGLVVAIMAYAIVNFVLKAFI